MAESSLQACRRIADTVFASFNLFNNEESGRSARVVLVVLLIAFELANLISGGALAQELVVSRFIEELSDVMQPVRKRFFPYVICFIISFLLCSLVAKSAENKALVTKSVEDRTLAAATTVKDIVPRFAIFSHS